MSLRRLTPAFALLGLLFLSACSTLSWGTEIRDPRVDPGTREDRS